MISALHLVWIIPLSAWFGFGIATILAVASREDNQNDSHEK